MANQTKKFSELFTNVDKKITDAVMDFLDAKRSESAAKTTIAANEELAKQALIERVKYPILLEVAGKEYLITPGKRDNVTLSKKDTRDIENLLAQINKIKEDAIAKGTATIVPHSTITVSAR